MIVIKRATRKNEVLEIEVTSEGRCVVKVDGSTKKCVKCEGPVFADYTAQGMGKGYVVNGICFVTIEEGKLLTDAIKTASDFAHKKKAQAREGQKAVAKQMWIEQGGVRLMYHEYNTGHPEYYLCYGELRERIYPVADLIPQRAFNEEHMAGHSWILDLVEYAAIAQSPITETTPVYALDDRLAGMPLGVDEIEVEQNNFSIAEVQYERGQESEAIASPPSMTPLSDLRKRYPRAVLYLYCQRQASGSSNDKNASAGAKALQLLLAGGTEADVRAVAADWR